MRISLTTVVAAAMVAVSGCGLAHPSAAATTAPIGDSCLVCRWIEQSYSSPGNWTWPESGGPTGPALIAASGLAGLVVTYAADGEETADYSKAAPVIGSYQGHQLEVVIRGTITFAVHADGKQISVASQQCMV